MTSAVEARAVSRRFGKTIALDGVEFSARTSSAHGLVGPVGSGKTTLLRILAALLTPGSGDVRVYGHSVSADPLAVRAMTGYVPSEFGQYSSMTASEYVTFFAACHGVPSSEREALARDLLQLVDLGHRGNTPLETLSPGMRRRLSLARALAHDPLVLLLDDPLAGLDPRGRVEVRELIRELRLMGKTILITSRNMGELEGLCDHITLLERGHVVAAGEYGVLAARLRPHRPMAITFLGESDAALAVAASNPGVFDARMLSDQTLAGAPPLVSEMRLNFDGDYVEASALLNDLLRAGVQVVSFVERADSLEAMFEKVGDGA
ncbi:MAG: ABC transporter ATP-binding protein [Thermoflexales bacterium]